MTEEDMKNQVQGSYFWLCNAVSQTENTVLHCPLPQEKHWCWFSWRINNSVERDCWWWSSNCSREELRPDTDVHIQIMEYMALMKLEVLVPLVWVSLSHKHSQRNWVLMVPIAIKGRPTSSSHFVITIKQVALRSPWSAGQQTQGHGSANGSLDMHFLLLL